MATTIFGEGCHFNGKNLPGNGSRGLRIAQLSDLHLTGDDQMPVMGVFPQRQLARVLADVIRFAPDLVLVTGDVANDGMAASYRRVRSAFMEFACPVYFIPGNHDEPAALAAVLGRAPLVSEAGNWRLVLLDSQVAGQDSGRVKASELAAAATLLSRSRRPVLVAVHHPPLSLGSPWLDAMGLEGSERLREWVGAHAGVRLVLAGHVHQAAGRRFAGAALYTSPSTCAQFVPRTARPRIEDRRSAWRMLWLGADGSVRTRIRRLKNPA